MAHHEQQHDEEKKSVNFWVPLVLGLIIWAIILIIETNVDEKDSLHHSEHQQNEQIQSDH